jgi:hypothetical protein
MYLTAQRVRSRTASGINVYKYLHGPTLPQRDGQPDIDRVTTDSPGYLVDSTIEIEPGGNDVLSALDVAADDDVGAEVIEGRLRAIEGHVAMATLPTIWRSEVAPVTVRLAARDVSGEPARTEYMELVQRLLGLLAQPVARERRDPYRFRLSATGNDYTLAPEPDTTSRLIAEGQPPTARSISAHIDVQVDMQGYVGPFLPHAIAALLNRDLHELVVRGGVVVVNDDGQVIWERLPPWS